MFALDPKIDVSEAKTISLAGQDYLIPPLMLRQTKRIPMAPLLEIMNRRAAAFAALTPGPDGKLPEPGPEFLAAVTLTEEETDIAILALAAGLSRAYPSVTVDALNDMPISSTDVIIAVSTVLQQSHATKPASASPGEA